MISAGDRVIIANWFPVRGIPTSPCKISERSLRCGEVENGGWPAGEVTNPVLDSPVGTLDPPDVGMFSELVYGSRDGRLGLSGRLSQSTESLLSKVSNFLL